MQFESFVSDVCKFSISDHVDPGDSCIVDPSLSIGLPRPALMIDFE